MFFKDNAAVIGLQWGDEGKGKLVDYLSCEFDVGVRYNGGNNAGHTVIIDDKTYKLRILPSSILRDNTISVIGNGVVLDPFHFINEINLIRSQGIKIDPEKLFISENCHLILPFHKHLDGVFESSQKIGTTKCGIGPCYQDKVARRGIRLFDLKNQNTLSSALDKSLFYHNILLKGLGLMPIEKSTIFSDLNKIAQEVLQYCISTTKLQHKLKNKKILFEGAQGMLLDIDHGTYPFVTSSSSGIGQIANGACLGIPKNILGILKCYNTRVGEGDFPTEQKNAIGSQMQKIGKEIGTVSNRTRRCGWFDAVLARYSASVAEASAIALTKIDVLDSFEKIQICNSYKINSKLCNNLESINLLHIAEPQYTTLDGWLSSTCDITNYNDMPVNAKIFINTIQEMLNLPVIMISTGAQRESVILKN